MPLFVHHICVNFQINQISKWGHSLDLETLQLILVLSLVCSYVAMPLYVYEQKKKQPGISFLQYFRFFSITDYIELTRKEGDAIGGWLWAFVISTALLVAVSITNIATHVEQSERPSGQGVTQELFPIL
jgi:uncharacterized membrane protein